MSAIVYNKQGVYIVFEYILGYFSLSNKIEAINIGMVPLRFVFHQSVCLCFKKITFEELLCTVSLKIRKTIQCNTMFCQK